MEKGTNGNADIMRGYMRYMKLERNYSPNTIEAYGRDLAKLTDWLDRQQLSLADVDEARLHAFAAALHDMGVGAVTQCRVLCSMRSLFRYLVADGYRPDDPMEHIPAPRTGEHLPEVLTTAEVDAMEDALDIMRPGGQRDRAIIEVLFSCGLRVSELVALRLSDLFLQERYVRVAGKGGKERLVPISDRAVDELEAWFEWRARINIMSGEEDYVFVSKLGRHLSRVMVLKIIKRQALAAGINKTISPHTLRHSFATALLCGGADLRIIQTLLGHERIATTEIYTHIDSTALRREILEHHPRNIGRGDS